METAWIYTVEANTFFAGALQGLSKERTAERLGRELVMKWRRSYYARPPAMTEDHPHFDTIINDARYRKLEKVPRTESLEDCQERVLEAWNDIVKDAQQAEDHPDSAHSLIVAHANTLRALVMHIDDIPAEEIEDLNIPTGIPFYYNLCKTTGQVLTDEEHAVQNQEDGYDANDKFRGIYISDDRKKRNFLERRRAANDPWLWALHDEQVARSMLLKDDDSEEGESKTEFDLEERAEDLREMAQEALENTELFSKVASKDR
jgi:Histidine phosphatase superfamily (branch 1)